MSPFVSLEKATVVSQGREPLGTECVLRTKSPAGATETSDRPVAPPGLDGSVASESRGSRPWLTTVAPFRGWARPAWALSIAGKLFWR